MYANNTIRSIALVLRGRNDNENIYSNFQQYNLFRPDLVRSDNSLYSRHYLTGIPMYDAIITDPPYGEYLKLCTLYRLLAKVFNTANPGIRAGARKSGSKLEHPRPVREDQRHDHIAQTRAYHVSDVMADLLNVAARNLVMGGRLVYIIPSMTDFDVKTDLPRHNCLKLVNVCYQPLQVELGRRVVTMEKVLEYDGKGAVWVNGQASAEKCARIRERLMEAAKSKPGYAEKARYRKQKRVETREAKKKAKREAKGNAS